MPDKSVNFDRAVEYYDATRGFPEGVGEQVGAFIAEKTPLNPQAQVLEVGIGTGRIALPLAPYIGSITGIDISTGMMQKLREKQEEERIYLCEGDAHFLPFAPKSFDVVCITHVLHLVPDSLRVLEEIQRVMKTGGHFLHMRNENKESGKMSALAQVWDDVTKHQENRVKRWDSQDETIIKAGWKLLKTEIFTYQYEAQVAHFWERVEKRQWSATWSMEDSIWQAGLEAIREAINDFFDGDMSATESAQGKFVVQVYQHDGA